MASRISVPHMNVECVPPIIHPSSFSHPLSLTALASLARSNLSYFRFQNTIVIACMSTNPFCQEPRSSAENSGLGLGSWNGIRGREGEEKTVKARHKRRFFQRFSSFLSFFSLLLALPFVSSEVACGLTAELQSFWELFKNSIVWLIEMLWNFRKKFIITNSDECFGSFWQIISFGSLNQGVKRNSENVKQKFTKRKVYAKDMTTSMGLIEA